MLIELHLKRDLLKPGQIDSANGTTVLRKLKAGEGEFHHPHVTVGFVLNRSPKHEMAFGDEKYVPTPLEAGHGWVLPSDFEWKARWSQELDFVNVYLSASALAKVNDGITPVFQAKNQILDPFFVQLAISLHETAHLEDTVEKMYRDTTMFTLAAHVNRIYGNTPMKPLASKLDPRFKRVIDIIESRVGKEISLEDLANAANMSPFHFSRSFKRAIGLPPHQYLATRRVEHAKNLLKSTQLPVTEIAYRVGYVNLSHFIQLFRRVTGCTPGEFRSG
jgi:AraC family transcriptional regulator